MRVRWPNIPLVQDGRLGDSLVHRDNNDFAPRIGIAWSPTPKWALRLAGGTFYNQDQGNPWFDVGRNAAGRSRNDDNPSFPAETWANALGSAGSANAIITTPQAFSMKFDRRTPYTHQYLFNVQRELAPDLTLEAGYLGSISRHLESYRGVSAAVPGPGTVASRSPYPNFGLLVLVDDGANGNYNSLAGKLTKRFSHGLDHAGGIHLVEIDRRNQRRPDPGQRYAVLAGWKLHALRARLCRPSTTASAWSSPASMICRSGKDGASTSRTVSLNALAGGWQLGSIVTWRSGFPINPSAGVNRANTNINVDRPDATGVSQSLDNRSTAQWFNVAAFALQPLYSFGNAGRNSIIGPPGFYPGLLRPQGLPDPGRTRPAVPMGGVQPAEPPRVGLPECQLSAAPSLGGSLRPAGPCGRCSSP